MTTNKSLHLTNNSCQQRRQKANNNNRSNNNASKNNLQHKEFSTEKIIAYWTRRRCWDTRPGATPTSITSGTCWRRPCLKIVLTRALHIWQLEMDAKTGVCGPLIMPHPCPCRPPSPLRATQQDRNCRKRGRASGAGMNAWTFCCNYD